MRGKAFPAVVRSAAIGATLRLVEEERLTPRAAAKRVADVVGCSRRSIFAWAQQAGAPLGVVEREKPSAPKPEPYERPADPRRDPYRVPLTAPGEEQWHEPTDELANDGFGTTTW